MTHGIVALLIPGVGGHDLVGDVHHQVIGGLLGPGRGTRGLVGEDDMRVVEQGVPGLLVHRAGDLDGVLLLEGFDRVAGMAEEVAGNRAGVVAKVGEALLDQLDVFTLAVVGVLFLVGDGVGLQVLPAVGHGDDLLLHRGGGGGAGLLGLGHRLVGEKRRLRLQVGAAGGAQAHLGLESLHGFRGGAEIVSGDLAAVIAEIEQAGLQALHVAAMAAELQGTVGCAEEDGQDGIVRVGAFAEAEICLEGFHGRRRPVAVMAGDLAFIVSQPGQLGLRVACNFTPGAESQGFAGGRANRAKHGQQRQDRCESLHGLILQEKVLQTNVNIVTIS